MTRCFVSLRLSVVASLAAALVSGAALAEGGPPQPLTLAEAVRYAREHAPAVGTAAAEELVARARIGVLDKALLPTLDGSLSASGSASASQWLLQDPTKCVGALCDRRGFSTGLGADASLNARWTLWDFGRTSSSVAAAEKSAEAYGYQVEAIALQASLQAAAAFLNVVAAEELLESRQLIVEARERALDVAQRRVEAGVAAPIEETRARVSLESARLELVAAESSVAEANVSLSLALGLEPKERVVIDRSSSLAEAESIAKRAAFAGSDVERPEIVAARLRTAASEAQESLVNASFLPSLAAAASLSTSISSDPLVPNALLGEQASVGVVLSIPLFDASRFAQKDEAAASTRAARAAERERTLAIQAETAQARIALATQESSLLQAEQLAHEAAENLRQALGRYEKGAGSLLELIDAQTQQAQAELMRIQARFALGVAQVRLAAAAGTLTAPE